ncbi:exodeoxyribonuclease III [Candidatus Uhrbacteria bacterium]|nr:exodeoxyribonuclease III [Candidatus Uhrbacteria bacterium]
MKNMTLLSWNVNGVRAAVKKGFLPWLQEASPDILCLQETKAHVEQLSHDIIHPDGYMGIWNSALKKGYSGTATFSKEKPLMEMSNFGDLTLDGEGRIILTEHKDFYLFNVYFPNGARNRERLDFKMHFYDRFLGFIEGYRKHKPVIICGDVNTAHRPVDLSHPKENEKTSGFLPMERKWLDKLEKHGYVDTFRSLHPKTIEAYSWWDMKTYARTRNIGWRIDYFWADKAIMKRIKKAFILNDVMGSDHCPVGIEIAGT